MTKFKVGQIYESTNIDEFNKNYLFQIKNIGSPTLITGILIKQDNCKDNYNAYFKHNFHVYWKLKIISDTGALCHICYKYYYSAFDNISKCWSCGLKL